LVRCETNHACPSALTPLGEFRFFGTQKSNGSFFEFRTTARGDSSAMPFFKNPPRRKRTQRGCEVCLIRLGFLVRASHPAASSPAIIKSATYLTPTLTENVCCGEISPLDAHSCETRYSEPGDRRNDNTRQAITGQQKFGRTAPG